MKLSILFMVITLLSFTATAAVTAQNVSLSLNNVKVEQVFTAITKQTGLSVAYSKQVVDINRRVNIHATNEDVNVIMDQLIEGTDLAYEIKDGKIYLFEKGGYAQSQPKKTITGVIRDIHGETVIGANVVERGTTNGVTTGLDGQFSLVVPVDATVDISYVGYLSQHLSVTEANTFDIILVEDLRALEEVIIVGYGSSTRRDLIASVSTVKTEQLANMPVTNIMQGMAGRAPGMIIKASGGGINSKPSMSIRGGDAPIYVIDGIIRSDEDFANLSSEDIESMSILKDASATAVYGSRATNGIIQVATKRGASGRPTVEYDFTYSLSQPGIWPEKMNIYDRALYGNIARQNDGLDVVYNEAALQAIKTGSDPLNFGNTDWRKLVLRDWAPQQRHTARLSGGNDNNHYYASLSHTYENSLYKANTNYMKRTNFRLSQTSFIEAINLRINATLDGYVQGTSHPYTSEAANYGYIFRVIQNRSPLIPGVNKHGLPFNTGMNMYGATSKDAGYIRDKVNVINGRGELVWTTPWVEGLKIRGTSNYRYYSNNSKRWRKDAALYDWDSTVPTYLNIPLLRKELASGYSFTNQAFADYGNTFGDHTISVLAGFEQYYQKTESYWLQRENYDFPIDQISVGDANTMSNGGSEDEMGRAAVIGQVKYNYANKYYVEGSIRYDGSDYFAPGKRWGAFFSGSLGWVVTEENFMRPLVEKDILNSLKLRASYGETGIDSGAGRFAYLTSYTLNTQSYVVDGAYAPGFTEGALASPDLTWYTTRQADFGFDFASLNNRLYGSFDYFYYSTKGYLVAPTGTSYINTALGVSMPRIKSDSEFRRAGYEFQLGWRSNVGDLKYDVAANFTYFDQLWALNESEAESSYMNPYQRTQQQKGYYGLLYRNLGYYASAADVFNNPAILASVNSGYLTAGDIKYEDTNGDGQITAADQRRLGKNSNPRGQFGININLEYKGFYFNTLFQGSTSFDMYISGETSMQSGQNSEIPVIYDYQTDLWTPSNTNAQYPRLMSNTALNANNNYASSDFWLVNGAYLRMKDFQFGYDLKQSVLKNINWLSKARVGISGQNIFTISKSTKYGLDPENASTQNDAYPVERTLAFTLNLGF